MRSRTESLKEFVAEADEILETLNQNLLEMEHTADKSAVRPDTINAVFRAAHTLKGMSGMVGLKKVAEVSHRLEDLLDNLRMGKLALTPALMDTLFRGLEVIRALIQSASSGKGEPEDTEAILSQIEAAMKAGSAAAGDDPLASSGIDPEIVKVLTDYESHRLRENLRRGAGLYEIQAEFKLETFDTDLVQLNRKVAALGEIITTLPSTATAAAGGISFRVLTGSQHDAARLRAELPGDSIRIVTLRAVGDRGASAPPAPVTEGGEASAAHAMTEVGGAAAAHTVSGSPAPPGQTPAAGADSIRSMTPTVRVDIGKLDDLLNVVGELVLTKAVITQLTKELVADTGFTAQLAELQKASQQLDRRVGELQEGLIEVRMIPVGQVFDRLVRIVRKLSRELGKEVDLHISGEETQLDKSMIEEIADPLMHLIRNALDHGIEPLERRRAAGKSDIGMIRLRAMQRGNNVVIEVEDDGGGIDLDKVKRKGLERGLIEPDREYERRDLFNLLFTPGFSTAEKVSEISGRGVGLDVVAKNIARLSGMVDLDSELGRGTRFSITLPITLVIIKALIVKVASETFAIPLNAVSESLMIGAHEIRTVQQREVMQLRDQTLPLLRVQRVFGVPGEPADGVLYVVVVGLAEKRVGLVVNAIEGQQEIVIKTLGDILRDTPGIAGATELGNRKTILVLDVGALIEQAVSSRAPGADSPQSAIR